MKNFFAKAKRFIAQIFSGIQDITPSVIQIVQAIKSVVDDERTSLLVALTPTLVDDKVLAVLRSIMAALFPESATQQHLNDTEAIEKSIGKIRKLTSEMKSAVYFKIGSLLLRHFAEQKGRKITRSSEADLTLQLAYTAQKNGIRV